MDCKTFSHINEHGTKTYKYKHKFNTLDDAIAECKKLNAKPNQLTKLVSYKCPECHKYHIGRNGKPVTEKYRGKTRKNQTHTDFQNSR
jgi:predicted RNA-binding Zn-ribbon protein involved in translation (DUF1610 family)